MQWNSMNLPETITHTPVLDIIDSSKLKTFERCPRKFFWRYVCGWEPQGSNIHLEFGSAWHLAMEHLLINGYSVKSIKDAWTLLNNHYRLHFPPEEDIIHAPKNPENAMVALMGYVEQYGRTDDFKVLYTEVAGSVPITNDKEITFKMDGVIQDDNGISILEHKTSSRDSAAWHAQWPLSLQTGTYTHALHSLFSMNEIYSVIVNGAFLRKKGNGFSRDVVHFSFDQLNIWLNRVKTLIAQIDWCYNMICEPGAIDAEVMVGFPICGEACTDFGKSCTYHDFCQAWPNPLRRCGVVQGGFKWNHWDPTVQDEVAKYHLNKDGIINHVRPTRVTPERSEPSLDGSNVDDFGANISSSTLVDDLSELQKNSWLNI